MTVKKFSRLVWEHYKKYGRHDLPWRKTTDPYKILVSEVMLQQTQVPRVREKYKSFIKKFPTANKLANAQFADVLKEWNGLGYNRRAKYLHEAANVLAKKKKLTTGNFSGLPGVGPYTVSAVRVLVFNERDILIETNIRAALIAELCGTNADSRRKIRDTDLLPFAEKAATGQDPREWHWALMDYGAHLKRSGVHNNHQSAHYTKQSKFEGSLRQVRGEILRQLGKQPLSERKLKTFVIASAATRSKAPRQNSGLLHSVRNDEKVQKALVGLEKDGLIEKKKGKWGIA